MSIREILTIIKKYDLDTVDLEIIKCVLENCSTNNINDEIKDALTELGYSYIYKDIIKSRKLKVRLTRFEKKMYYKKHKHLRKIKNYMPGWVYGFNIDTGEINYWERNYINDKRLKKCSNRKIRYAKAGEEDFNLRGCNYKHKFDYWGEVSEKI